MTIHSPRQSLLVEMPNPEVSACLGKEAFATPQLAHEVITKRRSRDPRQVYRCRYCGKFHVGRPG